MHANQTQVIDRSAVSRSLAKAIAYAQCGKQSEAHAWAAKLVTQLQCGGVLTPHWRNVTQCMGADTHPQLAPSMSCPSSDPSSELEGGGA